MKLFTNIMEKRREKFKERCYDLAYERACQVYNQSHNCKLLDKKIQECIDIMDDKNADLDKKNDATLKYLDLVQERNTKIEGLTEEILPIIIGEEEAKKDRSHYYWMTYSTIASMGIVVLKAIYDKD